MIHYPLTPIQEIYPTKLDTFKGSLVYQANTVKQLVGFTMLHLRDMDYLLIGDEWENIVILTYQEMQKRQFIQQYGEEY